MHITLTDYIAGVRSGTIQAWEIAAHYLDKAQHDTTNSWIRLHTDYVDAHIADFSAKPLAWAPIGIKDIIMTAWYETTCASSMLEGYIPPYSAHCFDLLEKAGGLMIGKTNMDEFAMWWSNESSAYGPVRNPHDATRISGGSSGWSAAAVAADTCIAALGTDTGGSVRQPAALCGVVWTKPTYGRVSRYGVQSLASSLDQVGVITKTVQDSELLLDTISGHDAHDATSQAQKSILWCDISSDLSGIKLALPREFMGEWLQDNVKNVIQQTIEQAKQLGATVEEISLPILSYGVPMYYILMPAEASTNLARYDGMRFGLQDDTYAYDTIYKYYEHIRKTWFGDEVKRRILTGSYVLSAWFYDAYYRRAQHMQARMKQELATVYETYDAIISPTSPSVAREIGTKIQDPIEMYLADIYTVIANLSGLPAISIPVGTALPADGDVSLPVWFQIMTSRWDESMMFRIAHVLEKHIGKVI